MSEPVARLAMITLDCADPEASARFWSAMLGWDVANASMGFFAAALVATDSQFGVWQRQFGEFVNLCTVFAFTGYCILYGVAAVLRYVDNVITDTIIALPTLLGYLP